MVLVSNSEFLQELELRNRKMTKDPLLYSSLEEIPCGLSGAKRLYGWTDSPFAGEVLVQVFQDIYYSRLLQR